MGLGLIHHIFFLDNISKGIEITLQLKGFFNQTLGILIGGDCKSFDGLLATVQVLHDRIRWNLQCKRRD